MTPHLTPFQDAHLSSDQYGGMTPGGSWTMVYGFAAIAVLILLVACFNFTNLATARAMVRAREISLRKVVGARRGQLMVQFLGESVLMALISLDPGAGADGGAAARFRPLPGQTHRAPLSERLAASCSALLGSPF